MKKLKFIIPFLILMCLVLVGAGCEKKEAGKEVGQEVGKEVGKEDAAPSAEESLTEILDKAKGVASYKYDAVITAPGQEVITANFWLKGNKLRWEGIYEGKNVAYLIDEGKQVAYLYIPSQKIAMKMNFGEAQKTVGDSPTEQSGSIEKYNPVTLGTEVLDGKTCLVIEYTDETGKTKMWLWTKYGFPIKTETTTTKGTTVVEIKNIEFSDISDSMFELPAGVQPMTIPSFGF